MSISEIVLAVAPLLTAVSFTLVRVLPLVSDRANKRAVRLAKAKRKQ
jgi:hypothetical protein